MDTHFDLWKQTAFGPATNRFSWRLALTEERKPQATEIRSMRVPDFAGISLHFEAAKGATGSRPHEILHSTGSRKNNCLFFEPSKFRTTCNAALSSRYPLKLRTF